MHAITQASGRALTEEQRMNPTVFIKIIHTTEKKRLPWFCFSSLVVLAVAGETKLKNRDRATRWKIQEYADYGSWAWAVESTAHGQRFENEQRIATKAAYRF